MINQIRTYIHRHQLLCEGRPVVVGLSGGADSVALLAILVRLGYDCIALHCNFHLRGEESQRDERFAEEFATQTLRIPFYKIDFDTEKYVADHHLSIEMAARELRYGWFEQMRQQLKAQAIAVAHHRDDSVETLLMNLVRGTGIRGMVGIRPKNGYVVRPLLPVSRQDITAWLSAHQYAYVTDSTNLSDVYTRNFIRLRVLPLLEEINPSVRQSIARSAEHLSAVEAIYQATIEKARQEVMVSDCCLSIAALMKFPSPEAILYELLKPFGFTRLVSDDLFHSLTGESGKIFYAKEYRLVKDREYLMLAARQQEEMPDCFQLEEEEGVCHYPIELSWHKTVLTKQFQFEKDRSIAYLDADKVSFPLILRRWKEGDWFIPFGMKGRKKVSDYFTDQKLNRFQKEQTWILCSGDDIVWIVGQRSDNRFRITSDSQNILMLKFSQQI